MQLDHTGISIIKNFEGLKLKAYQDEAGIWTIGYGSTYYIGGNHVKAGDTLTGDLQATQLLINTVAHYEQAVNSLVKVPLNQHQYNALVSFTYNEGTGALEKSSLLKKLNLGDYQGAADQFLVWNKITDPHSGQKVVSQTLAIRRNQERQLFLN